MRCGSGSRAGGVEIEAVDDVAAIGRQGHAVLRLGVGRARLGELPGEPAELDHRAAGAEGQHHRHLQQHLEGVADVVRVELGEALGAVAALQQEGLAGGDIGQPVLQPPRLAGEDQRREAVQRLLDPGERGLVGIARHLPDRQAAPALGASKSRASQFRPHALRVSTIPSGMATSAVGGRSTRGRHFAPGPRKRESRLGGRLSGKREYAILGRRHVPAVPKSRNLTSLGGHAGTLLRCSSACKEFRSAAHRIAAEARLPQSRVPTAAAISRGLPCRAG